MDTQNSNIPIIIAPKIFDRGKEKRSEFKAIIKIPIERNPWYLTATSKESNCVGAKISFNACAPMAPRTMDNMMNNPERKTNCFCILRSSEKIYSYQICIFVK